MIRSTRRLRSSALFATVASVASLWSLTAAAEITLTDPAKTNGWEVTVNGRVDAYLSWVWGETATPENSGNLIDPANNPSDRYKLLGPQIGIQGNPTPAGATADQASDKTLSAPRIRGGFASTILAFNVYNQISEDVKLTIKLAFWAGIQNGTTGTSPNIVRAFNDVASVDWREQYLQLEGSWGSVWGGRRIGLYNRGGMKMNWYLIHQQGVGHPCNVDSSSSATCGNTGVGSMFPARHAQLGYATPDIGGFQVSVAMLDPAMIDGNAGLINGSWNRTPLPRFEGEATYHKAFGANELNIWANGLSQVVARTNEALPDSHHRQPGCSRRCDP